jgi:hypothetical protein
MTPVSERRLPVIRLLLVFCLACFSCVAILAVAAWGWLNLRPQPRPVSQSLFEGILYQREVRQKPRPMVIHIITVDLKQPGISFLVTPGDPESSRPLRARTTSQFLDEYGAQIAVNGDGFNPWVSNSLLDYYPHSGDPVAPAGFAASRGTVYAPGTAAAPVLYLSRTNQARFNAPIGKIYNAISGSVMLVEQGKVNLASNPLDPQELPQPRTAVALDKSGKRLILVLVDGRQRSYSEGATLTELAEIILAHGGYTGMNLDGGGSTTLVMESKKGKSDVLNSPVDQHIPGRERPVGNHLGIFAGSGEK